MSSILTLANLLNFSTKQVFRYFAISVFILGFIGGFLNIIVFLSLKTFRQSSCAFYLMIMSTCDLGRFVSSSISYIMDYGFGIYIAAISLLYCKLSVCIFVICSLGSMTCLCLAIIDQYFATSSRLQWQQCCNIKLAHRLTAIILVIWSLQAIPYAIFYNYIPSYTPNRTLCQITNAKFNIILMVIFLLLQIIISPSERLASICDRKLSWSQYLRVYVQNMKYLAIRKFTVQNSIREKWNS